MNTQDNKQSIVKRLDDSPDLVDIMISIEDYLDTSNMYVFKNWIDGELIDGPYVEPYWVTVSFKWPYDKMPDPMGGMRLLQHGTKIFFKKEYENVPQPIHKPSDYQPGTHKPQIKPEKVWVVEMKIPRRFIDEIDDKILDLYNDKVELDNVGNIGKVESPMDISADVPDASVDMGSDEGMNDETTPT